MKDDATQRDEAAVADAGDERWMTAETHDLARAIASLEN